LASLFEAHLRLRDEIQKLKQTPFRLSAYGCDYLPCVIGGASCAEDLMELAELLAEGELRPGEYAPTGDEQKCGVYSVKFDTGRFQLATPLAHRMHLAEGTQFRPAQATDHWPFRQVDPAWMALDSIRCRQFTPVKVITLEVMPTGLRWACGFIVSYLPEEEQAKLVRVHV
jgi:hypothetical protein